MNRQELLNKSKYWVSKIQIELYNELLDYMQANNLSQKDLAEKLGVTQGYVSQLLNGNFNHKIEKLVDLSLIMGKVPIINYPTLENYKDQENKGVIFPYKFFQYYEMQSPIEMIVQSSISDKANFKFDLNINKKLTTNIKFDNAYGEYY